MIAYYKFDRSDNLYTIYGDGPGGVIISGKNLEKAKEDFITAHELACAVMNFRTFNVNKEFLITDYSVIFVPGDDN